MLACFCVQAFAALNDYQNRCNELLTLQQYTFPTKIVLSGWSLQYIVLPLSNPLLLIIEIPQKRRIHRITLPFQDYPVSVSGSAATSPEPCEH